MTNKNKSQSMVSRFKRPLPLLVLTLIAALIVVAGLELTNTTHIFHKRPVAKVAVISATSPNKQPKKTSTSKTSTSTPTTSSSIQTTNTKGSVGSGSAPSGAAPSMPSGTFVSNHSPNLSGKPYPSQEQSVCNTTPGASCSIKFTNGGLVRTLPEEVTDSNGSAYWNWDVNQDPAFTEGTWTVTVTASLNGQTASAQDSLKVGP